MLRIFIQHRLPVPAVELVVGPDGSYRLDFAYPLLKLAIEVDGYVWHFSPEQQRRDHRRRNRLHINGWQVLVFTWLDVTRQPHEVAGQIREALCNLGPA
jgi:very-short-patch-repair endonuclease